MKKGACLLVLTLAGTAFPGCGGDDDSTDVHTYCRTGDQTSGGSGETLVVTADASGAPMWKPTTLQAESGRLTIELKNPSPRCHDIVVRQVGGEVFGNTQRVKQGKANVVLDLKPGEYLYHSTIEGEQAAGMRGTLTVR